jgi:hypothetical protein
MSALPSLMQVLVPDADVNPIALVAFDRQGILDFRFWILDWGLGIKETGFFAVKAGCSDFRFEILDFGLGIGH